MVAVHERKGQGGGGGGGGGGDLKMKLKHDYSSRKKIKTQGLSWNVAKFSRNFVLNSDYISYGISAKYI